MSHEILSDVTRNFIECMNLKKSNILSKSQFMVMSHEILSPVARSFIECMNLKKGNILSKIARNKLLKLRITGTRILI